MTEEELLDVFARYAQDNGGDKSCEFMARLLISTLLCAEQVGTYEAEFANGKVTVNMDKT